MTRAEDLPAVGDFVWTRVDEKWEHCSVRRVYPAGTLPGHGAIVDLGDLGLLAAAEVFREQPDEARAAQLLEMAAEAQALGEEKLSRADALREEAWALKKKAEVAP